MAEVVVTKVQRDREVLERLQFHNNLKLMAAQRRDAMKQVRFTKALVLEGTKHREHILVPELGEGAYLTIRPLTDIEFIQVQKVILGDISAVNVAKLEATMTDIVEREANGKYFALSIALSVDGEEWTPEDVGNLPPGVPDILYNTLAVISGFPRPLDLSVEEPEDENG
jgi:hypothetical protein